MQSCYFDNRISKPFESSCCVFYVSCFVHYDPNVLCVQRIMGFFLNYQQVKKLVSKLCPSSQTLDCWSSDTSDTPFWVGVNTSPSYGIHHIKECMGNLKLSPKCTEKCNKIVHPAQLVCVVMISCAFRTFGGDLAMI